VPTGGENVLAGKEKQNTCPAGLLNEGFFPRRHFHGKNSFKNQDLEKNFD
jgi:hypothetical protein